MSHVIWWFIVVERKAATNSNELKIKITIWVSKMNIRTATCHTKLGVYL